MIVKAQGVFGTNQFGTTGWSISVPDQFGSTWLTMSISVSPRSLR